MSIKLLKTKRRYGFTPAITPGASPVDVKIAPQGPPPKITIIGYGPDNMAETVVQEPEDIFDRRLDWPVLWVNVSGGGDESLFKKLEEKFHIHPLVIEDVINKGQRPKIEEYDDSMFLVLHTAHITGETFQTGQLAVFIRGNAVVTFLESDWDPFEHLRERIRKGKSRIRNLKADYLVYTIMDSVIDHYFPLLEAYGEKIEILEDDVLESPDSGIMPQIQKTRHGLLTLRRIIWPVRDILNKALSEEADFFEASTRIYLRDCYDHSITAIDLLETYREVCSSLSDIYLSSLSNRMNEVMRVLTLIATIFIPLTFIAGIYGMNFDPSRSPWNMPELKWYWGYPLVLLIMAGVAFGMIILFKRKKWL